jgi:anti-anti-sigma factor
MHHPFTIPRSHHMEMSLLSPRAPLRASEGGRPVSEIAVYVREAPEEMVICIVGEATVGLADALARLLLRPIVRRPKLVTLDLSGLKLLSCLAMGTLVTFRRGVVRAGGRVRLAAALQGPVRESLERAGLLTLFDSSPRDEAALPGTTCYPPNPGRAGA